MVPRYRAKTRTSGNFRPRRSLPSCWRRRLDQGAKTVVHAHRDETLEIDTEDAGVTIDIDTPEEYRKHVKGK